MLSAITANAPLSQVAEQDKRLLEVATKLEASFLAEMLKAAKFAEPRSAFGGGVGEDQFSSFFREEIAKEMAQTGGIGLAEHLFEALKQRQANGTS